MFLKALLSFAALPGVVAFLVPAFIATFSPSPSNPSVLACATAAFGIGVLLWCVWAFYSAGKGTLAPWSPPKYLVTIGLYRISRNPMYVGVALVLVGWSWYFESPAMCVYTACVIVAFHLRVVFGEEPWLARTHGQAWQKYKGSAPRWLGAVRWARHEKRDA